jgi:cell fate regulator YaaT (PSP1 superfamily)
MKIKFELELDTNEDQEIGRELVELLSLLKERIELMNEEYYDD